MLSETAVSTKKNHKMNVLFFKPAAFKLFFSAHEGVFVPNQNYYSKLKVLFIDVEKITTPTGYDVFFLYIKLETVSTLMNGFTEQKEEVVISFLGYPSTRPPEDELGATLRRRLIK